MQVKVRIEYLDALRGFVMLLVVLGHVPMYCYHQLNGISFSAIPSTFHLALFFFISGWFAVYGLRFTVNSLRFTVYGLRFRVYRFMFEVYHLFKKKFVQLVVPTVVFYLLFCWMNNIDVVENLWNDKFKGGYWFCIVLFVFYLTMTVAKAVTEKLGGALLVLLLALAMMMLNTNMVTDMLARYNIPNVLCIQQWQYFIFFYMGYMAHRYQTTFFSWLDNGMVMAVAVVVFFGSLLLWYQQPMNLAEIKLTFLLWGGLGTLLSFAFFRKYEDVFSHETRMGRWLQYVGQRTLDVYLLHFFFLPGNLEWLGRYVMGNGNPTVELFVSLAIAIMVVSLCLLMGNIIRLSPILAHWLLGVKRLN
jgi:fucose 4-O-acetylase-like acetyltransferase